MGDSGRRGISRLSQGKPTARLLLKGEEEPRVFDDVTQVSIGRGHGMDIQLDDGKASRLHCTIRFQRGQFVLADEGSQNGTFVNGAQVIDHVLEEGDVIKIGDTELCFGDVATDASPSPSVDENDEKAAEEDSQELIKRLTRERSNLFRLMRINRDISKETDLKTLLKLIVDSAIELTGAERGFLIHYRDGEPSFEIARHFDGGEVSDPELAVSRSIAEDVRERGEPVTAVNARDDDRFRSIASISNLGLRSVLAVPFKFRGDVVGAVYVDNRLAKGVFNEEALRLVEALADQAAIALKQATLLDSLKSKNVDLEHSNAKAEGLAQELKKRVAVQEVELAEARARLKERGESSGNRFSYPRIIGRTKAMQGLFQMLDKVVESDFPVLIQGESGTGKELIARAIHENSPRRSEPFVSENCAALPDSLLESELFGHEKGSFTGATSTKKGLFEVANKGTLFLDEVGEMSVQMQKKLLRVLQEGEFRRVGGHDPIRIDVRLISASNRDLLQLADKGEFRHDLFYRLNVLPINLPPLRERLDDVPLLVDAFIRRFSAETGEATRSVRPEVLEVLKRYRWPGNVRELENEVRKMLTLGDEVLDVASVSERIRYGADHPGEEAMSGTDLVSKVESIEKAEIRRALRESGRNKSRAATILGISRFTLQRKLDKYEIDPTAV